MAKFAVNDIVEWTSQAGGNTRTKRGHVVAIVPPKDLPSRSEFPSLYKLSGIGLGGRKEESYVVAVKKPRSVTFYWPWPKNLRLVSAPPTLNSLTDDQQEDFGDICESQKVRG